ncbi:hypothetical protein F3Y22_tig00111392pilonHSYRG00331 [Hibiscus syriacus]|uniref:Membrane-associated kinase regulator 1 n=1 Tax=Hibiscus syriacus TaxID=106335 RepID=A0A6A2XWJ5_HIBSY|nr:uncharacterized protein LOC120160215 [Hibiscus syriacus]KAE8680132.1 hypothetical protein F3Y22_tig00111392pilonHSYRG00331 [Hibiscus syriacus]
METLRKRSSSGEIFSFPITQNEELDSEFEFGCFTPDSPSQDLYRTSPADHLFCNGRLLPHAFPLPPAATTAVVASGRSSRETSRTSSINSKDSLMSSRSNSTNSRSSCSSARTSSSDNSERRLLCHSKIHACNKASKMVTAQLYGDAQRWQYITAVPVLKREASRRKNSGVERKDALRGKKQGDHQQQRTATKGRSEPCLRFFSLFLLACRECHAMEPSKKQE